MFDGGWDGDGRVKATKKKNYTRYYGRDGVRAGFTNEWKIGSLRRGSSPAE